MSIKRTPAPAQSASAATEPAPVTAPILLSEQVSSQWLADHLGSAAITIVDARPAPEHLIPGAISGEGFAREASVQQPERTDTSVRTIVIYHDAEAHAESDRLRRVATESGHTNVAELRGGFDRWVAEGRPLDERPLDWAS